MDSTERTPKVNTHGKTETDRYMDRQTDRDTTRDVSEFKSEFECCRNLTILGKSKI